MEYLYLVANLAKTLWHKARFCFYNDVHRLGMN